MLDYFLYCILSKL